MTETKIPDLQKESKQIEENVSFLYKIIKNNPRISFWTIVVLLILMGLILFSYFENIPLLDKKISITTIKLSLTKCKDLRIDECAFSMDREGTDWKIGEDYTFKWVLKSNIDFYGHVIVYLRPAIENGLKAPLTIIDESDKSLMKNVLTEFEGVIYTTGASSGRYNLCGILKDNNANMNYIYETCDSRQIVIR